MPEYTGLYRGSAYDVNDPERRGRIRALIPQVMGDSPSGWAEPTLGTKELPNIPIKGRVWILFEGGDINRPTYIARMEVTGADIKDGTIVPANLSDDFDFGGSPTDGLVPDHSPTPTTGSISQGIFLRWDEVDNPDLVLYRIFMDTTSTVPVNDTTFYDHTTSLSQIINSLPDGSPLVYGTTYWFRILAADADGPALTASAAVSGTPGKMDGGWLVDQSVTGTQVGDFALAIKKFNNLEHHIY